MAQSVSIDKNGNVTVDGKTITPQEVVAATSDIQKAWVELSNRSNWNIKNVERVLVYGATIVTTTNVMGQIPLSTGVKAAVLGAAAFVLGAIHISTPKA